MRTNASLKDDAKQFSENFNKRVKVGEVADDWVLPVLGGDSIRLSQLRGKVVVLGINPADKNEQSLKLFAQKYQINYPILFKAFDVAKNYKVSMYPSYIIIDQEGKIAYIREGYAPRYEKRIKKAIEELLAL